MNSKDAYDRGKRILDVVVSAAGLIITAPLQLAAAAAVAVGLGRPVLFRQARPGLNGRPFELIKFRTMLPVNEELGLISDRDRLSTFGRILRATSLDELPSLWNVLMGDMSLVGPRPLLTEYLSLYTPEQARRHAVRPGITGLAQVAGRNQVEWERRLALDVLYVESRSLRLDLSILARTLSLVLRRKGVSAADSVTMSPFCGSYGSPGASHLARIGSQE
jgi:lipopolysaccharide/colanic/teichoic acid biosynthesis glycosyltransferase